MTASNQTDVQSLASAIHSKYSIEASHYFCGFYHRELLKDKGVQQQDSSSTASSIGSTHS